MNYGMPYKGSKNKIAKKIIGLLPSGKVLFDLFGGGGAITHCALLSGKWEKVVYNELDPVTFKGFDMAVHGKFKDERRWISRDEFFKLKDSDPYVALCFSFGNDMKTYCYSDDAERYKEMLHRLICGETTTERRLAYKRFIRAYNELRLDRRGDLQNVEALERLQSLERLERLQSLERLERLQSLELSNRDYAEVELSNRDYVIYCDIPYLDTNTYNFEFDYDRFYEWVKKQENIFISSYTMPDDFECVATIPRRGNMSAVSKDGIKEEKLFIPRG